MRKFVAVLIFALPAVLLPAATGPAQAAGRSAKVIRWIDGDTVKTTQGTVRLIGIDTPEVGKCGSGKATKLAKRLAPAGSRIRLANPTSVQSTDRHGRLLRYVNRGHVDVGMRQVKAGAAARYDSVNGYDRHPRQSTYRATDRKHRNYHCRRAGGDLRPYAPVPGTWNCPRNAPIKGNQGSPEWIYHMPEDAYYDATNPEECFATRAGAERAGYRAARV